LMAEAGGMLGGEYLFDQKYIRDVAEELHTNVHGVVQDLVAVTGERYPDLLRSLAVIDEAIQAALNRRTPLPDGPLVLPMETVGLEHSDAVGEKMARLGEIRNRLGLPTPGGFVASTRACWDFLHQAGLMDSIRRLESDRGDAPEVPGIDARTLQDRIRDAEVPGDLAKSIRRAARNLIETDENLRFAVRSSGAGEDGDLVAAGQFTTRLGVRPEELCEAYKDVVASLFDPRVLTYQRNRGAPPGQGMMAVGFLAMVPARASGVAYSLDPLRPDQDVQMVAAAWGLGKAVVEGREAVDRFTVRRSPERPILSRRIARKNHRYVVASDRGVILEPVPEEAREEPSLSDAELRTVSEAACRIERYMKCAQDVEWAMEPDGGVIILQARPLRIQPITKPVAPNLREELGRYPVLLRGKGEVACRGIASGRVLKTESPSHPEDPDPGEVVLVARSASPELGSRLARASAVITDVGNATGHFAAVAREARIPTIVDTSIATSVLQEGQEITVDAEENVVYLGRVEELLHYQLMKSASFEDAAEFRTLKRMLRRIVPLNLHDPQDRGFAPDRCQTYHDVIRFAHEKAVASLTKMEWVRPSMSAEYVRRLDLPIPLDLILVDLGGGIQAPAEGEGVVLENVACRPLLPLLSVLCGEGGWETAPADMDLHGFMSSATRALPLTSPLTSRPEQNLALISREYLHLSLRLGYHFNVVDTYLTDRANDNYIYFRFLGGVTEIVRRSRRATLLRQILERFGFVVEGKGDLVIGRTRGLTAALMVERMRMLGRLIGYTRQLDIHLRDDSRINEYLERFLEGDENFDSA